jgi:hypothetical protein
MTAVMELQTTALLALRKLLQSVHVGMLNISKLVYKLNYMQRYVNVNSIVRLVLHLITASSSTKVKLRLSTGTSVVHCSLTVLTVIRLIGARIDSRRHSGRLRTR